MLKMSPVTDLHNEVKTVSPFGLLGGD